MPAKWRHCVCGVPLQGRGRGFESHRLHRVKSRDIVESVSRDFAFWGWSMSREIVDGFWVMSRDIVQCFGW